MKKKTAIALIIPIILIGSFITFYTSNLIFSDVGNMFYGEKTTFCVGSLTGFMFTMDIVLAAIFVLRFYMRPKVRKQIVKTYTVILAAFSLAGLISTIYAGITLYKSFLAPYPFPGYIIIGIVVHLSLLIAGIVMRVKIPPKMPNDPVVKKATVPYVIYSIATAVLVFLAFNRLGALLWAPVYAQTRTLYMTFPFYLSLLLPIGLLAHIGFRVFDTYNIFPNSDIINLVIIISLNAVLGGAVILIGRSNTQFISAISPALALERLASLPIDTLLQYGLTFIMAVYFLIDSIIHKKKGIPEVYKR